MMGGTIANKHPEFKFNAEICQFLEQFGLAKHSVSVAIVSQYGPGDHCTGGFDPPPQLWSSNPQNFTAIETWGFELPTMEFESPTLRHY